MNKSFFVFFFHVYQAVTLSHFIPNVALHFNETTARRSVLDYLLSYVVLLKMLFYLFINIEVRRNKEKEKQSNQWKYRSNDYEDPKISKVLSRDF